MFFQFETSPHLRDHQISVYCSFLLANCEQFQSLSRLQSFFQVLTQLIGQTKIQLGHATKTLTVLYSFIAPQIFLFPYNLYQRQSYDYGIFKTPQKIPIFHAKNLPKNFPKISLNFEQTKKSLFFMQKIFQEISLKFPQISSKQKFPCFSVKKFLP